MVKARKNKFWETLFGILILAGFFGFMIDMHEEVHVSICEYYGGVATRMDFSHVWCGGFEGDYRFVSALFEMVDYVIVVTFVFVLVLKVFWKYI